jgi:hypothetical protein
MEPNFALLFRGILPRPPIRCAARLLDATIYCAVLIAQEANRKSRQRSPLCRSRWQQFVPAISGHSLALLLPCVGSFRRTELQKVFQRGPIDDLVRRKRQASSARF